jgi:hypothetical protein
MEKYIVIRDGSIIGCLETREEALEMIEQRKKRETHWLKSEYWIIKGTEEFI